MSLFADFAKSAFKSAQKRIDTVLDIHPENEDEEEEEENVLQPDDIPLESPPNECDEKDKLDDDHEVVKTEKHETWQWEGSSETGVVVSEPNPARDLHVHGDVGICSDSPNSLSPTDDTTYVHQHHSAEHEHHEDHIEEHTDDTQMSSELFEPPDDHVNVIITPQFDPHRDEIVTIASSDIEVIRQHDEWSTVSSQRPPTTDAMSISNLPLTVRHTIQNLTATESGSDAVLASLKSQIGMKDRQIEDMSSSNKSLLQINTTLKQQNKKLTDKLHAMSKMQKQIVEKDNQIEELFGEGKKLSELNGRQSTEIKRLRQELTQMDVVISARDSAVAELQAMTKKLEATQQDMTELEARLETAENANAKVLMDLSQTQEDTDITQRQYLDQLHKINEFENVIQNLKTELAVSQREKNDLSAERDAEQRQRMKLQTEVAVKEDQVSGLMTDKDALNEKIDRLKATSNSFENRIQKMMDNERHNAGQVASATGPLISRIEELEVEVREYRGQYSVVNSRCQALESVQMENEALKRTFENEIRHKVNQINQLTTKQYELESSIAELETEKVDAQNKVQDELTKVQSELAAERESANVIRKNYQEQVHELRLARERNSELTPKVSAQDAEIQRLHTRIAEMSNRSPEPVVPPEIDSTYSAHVPSPLPAPTSVVDLTLNSNTSQPNFVDYDYTGTPNESTALHSELRNMKITYSQSTTRIHQLQDELAVLKQKNVLLAQEKDQKLSQLNEDYEVLLDEYGSRVEQIEELQMDIDELRKIVAQQAETVANLESRLRQQ